jgi:hypothetical protein
VAHAAGDVERLAIDATKSMPFPGTLQGSAFFVAERAVRALGELLGAKEGDLRPVLDAVVGALGKRS